MYNQSRPVFCLGHLVALGGVLALLTPPATFGVNAYLSEVGPPAIRIDSISQRGTVVPTEFCFDESKPKPPTAVAPAKAPLLATVSTNQTDQVAQAIVPSSSTQPASSAQPVFPGTSQQSLQDINIVTPKMLMEYLKPGMVNPADVDGKRPALFYPGKFDFTPPMEVNRSSTAVYKKE
jgi:hypothetical protein